MNRHWLASYPEGVAHEIDTEQFSSLNQLLEDSFKKNAAKPFSVCMDCWMSYGELDTLSSHLGAWLQSLGLEPNARVAIMLPNVPQFAVTMAAILRAGYTCVNVNPLYTARELEHQLTDSGTTAIVILENFAGTLASVGMRRGVYSFDAYASVINDPQFWQTFSYSIVLSLFTILLGTLIVVPTAYWVRLKLPHLRPLVEFITLLPLVIPTIVIAFGYIRMYNTSSFLPLLGTSLGTDVLLTCGYVIIALPFMYRAVDTGLRAIDIATLTEAAQSLGASWFTIIARVILPNVLVAVLSGAFITFAIVIGEYVLAALLDRPAFGPYLVWSGSNKAYEPSALAVISFAITWGALGLIQLIARANKHTKAQR